MQSQGRGSSARRTPHRSASSWRKVSDAMDAFVFLVEGGALRDGARPELWGMTYGLPRERISSASAR
eukprot:15469747-Alexandrium_andersonii.AAC.1